MCLVPNGVIHPANSLAHTNTSEALYACVHSPRLLGSVLPHSTGLGPLESLYNLCLCLFAQVTREQRSATLRRASVHSRVSLCMCSFTQVNVTREAAFSHIATGLGLFESSACLYSFTQVTRGQRSATLRRALVHSRVSVCLCSSAQVTWEQRSDTLRRALGLLESLCIVVFILVCGFAAVLDPLWKALLQALHSREIFSCTTDNRKRKKNVPF